MFNIGDLVVYNKTGVCRVNSVGKSTVIKSDSDYYTLKPLHSPDTIYVPVDTKAYMRAIMDKDEAQALILRLDEIPEKLCTDRRLAVQKEFYGAAIQSHNFEEIIGIIKGLYTKSTRPTAGTKPLTSTETQFFAAAKSLFEQEISASLDIELESVPQYIQTALGR